ncbi:dienelactone hydrolase, partial [Kaistia algarum]
PVLAADVVGVKTLAVPSPARGRDLAVTIWYPATPGGAEIRVGESKLFRGAPAFADAPLARGHFPLILVSHGSGARIENLGWIANRLVAAGFIVAGPNHPGTTSGDSTPIDTPNVWERTADLSTLLTALTENPDWRDALAERRVGVLGFSLGGTTAMELAGATIDREAYARYCDTYPAMMDCIWFAGGKGYVDGKEVPSQKVDLRQMDKSRFEHSNRDPRIASAVLVDPGMAKAFQPASLEAIAIPMHFINLGGPETVPPGVIADDLARLTPKGDYAQVQGAVHFTFLAECQVGGKALLVEIGEADQLCDDGGTRPRADMHAELGDRIAADFAHDLKPAP